MSGDFAQLEAVHDLLVEAHAGSEGDGPDEGFLVQGAIVIGLYVAPDGQTAGIWHRNIGGMNAFTQEGVLRYRLRDLIEHLGTDDD